MIVWLVVWLVSSQVSVEHAFVKVNKQINPDTLQSNSSLVKVILFQRPAARYALLHCWWSGQPINWLIVSCVSNL
jgi:disulfide bond formation protein DsbB